MTTTPNGASLFRQRHDYYERDKRHAARFRFFPGIDATGQPGVFITNNRSMFFIPGDEAVRITNAMTDALEDATHTIGEN